LASPYRVLLWLRTDPPQVDGEIGPLGLVGSDTEFFFKKKGKNEMSIKEFFKKL